MALALALVPRAMTARCVQCGAANQPDGLCPYRVAGPEWAIANRIMCDLLHRRIEPPPVAFEDFVNFEDVA